MTRLPLLPLACAAIIVLAQTGCATVFSGSSQDMGFGSAPPGATVIVIGGPVGSALLAGKKYSDRVQTAIGILKKVLPASAGPSLAKLERLNADELVTKLALWLKFDRIPAEIDPALRFDIPLPAELAILELLGFEATGVAPFDARVGKGEKYAVIAYWEGRRAKVYETEESFNFLFLLNIFNAFLLCPVDIVSGAWFNVRPERYDFELGPPS